MNRQIKFLLSGLVLISFACNNAETSKEKTETDSTMKISITEKPFGTFEGNAVTEYTLTNANGMQVSILNYGGTVTKIITNNK